MIYLNELGIEKGSRVIVAMSGGVDSSVTALMAQEAGLTTIGITMQMFDNKNEFWHDAKNMAEFLGRAFGIIIFSYHRFIVEDVETDSIAETVLQLVCPING